MARIQWKLKMRNASYNHKGRGIKRIGEIIKYATMRKGLFSMPAASVIAFLKTQKKMTDFGLSSAFQGWNQFPRYSAPGNLEGK